MSRRALCGLLILALLLGMLSGCGAKETASSAEEQEAFGDSALPENAAIPDALADVTVPKRDGTFSLPYNNVYGWDPFACIGMENRAVMQLVYEGLFCMDSEFEAAPVLCEDYTVSDDGLNYTITLRDATFSSGQILTSEDVVYSYTLAVDSPLYSERYTDVSYMSAVDGRTISLRMRNPSDRILCMLDFPVVPNQSSLGTYVGTGPFIRSANALNKNPDWWGGADSISFDTVNLVSSTSAEYTRDCFEIDLVHFVYNNPMAFSAADYHCDFELWNSRSTVLQYLGFNFTYGICQDESIRQGILRAIDRASIAESVYHNYADPAVLPVSPYSTMYDDDLALDYSYSFSSALDILMNSESFYLPDDSPVLTRQNTGAEAPEEGDPEADEAGEGDEDAEEPEEEDPEYEDEYDLEDAEGEEEPDADGEAEDGEDDSGGIRYNRVTMLVTEGNEDRLLAAKQVVSYLEAVGFSVDLKIMPYDEFIYTLNNGEWDMYYADYMMTPDFDLRPLVGYGGSMNYSRIPLDETMERLYLNAMENAGNRYDLYQHILDHAYICPVLFENNAVYTTRGVFTGLDPTPDNLFYNIQNIELH